MKKTKKVKKKECFGFWLKTVKLYNKEKEKKESALVSQGLTEEI